MTINNWHINKRLGSLVVLLLSVCLLWNCEKPDPVISKEINNFTIEHQITIGQLMKAQLLEMPEVYPILDKERNRCAYDRIEILFKTLLNTSVIQNRRTFNWQIHIIDKEEIKTSFTLPGGHLYIYKGLLNFINTESELMAVIGNEIAYADNGYTLQTLRAEHGNSIMSDLSLGNKVPSLSEMLIDLPYLGFEKATILQADSVSIALICPFQYDANSLERFIDRATVAEIPWTISKGGNLSNRFTKLKAATADCGKEEATFEGRYQSFLKECF